MSERRAKYGNRGASYDGVSYASVLERDVALTLDLLRRAEPPLARVQEWRRQVRYELLPRQQEMRPVYYVADFVVVLAAPGTTRATEVIVEAKGMQTRESKLKHKLLRWRYPALRVVIVRSATEVVALATEVGRQEVRA